MRKDGHRPESSPPAGDPEGAVSALYAGSPGRWETRAETGLSFEQIV